MGPFSKSESFYSNPAAAPLDDISAFGAYWEISGVGESNGFALK